jgi:hypothetical protein
MRFRLHMPLLPNATIAIAIAGVPPAVAGAATRHRDELIPLYDNAFNFRPDPGVGVDARSPPAGLAPRTS